jgi:hypothetical protein
MNKKILITGARAPSSLELARILSKSNTIYVADSLYFPLARFSFSVQKFFYLKKPIINIQEYKDQLIKIIKENNIEILIPTCEEAFFISKIKDELSKYCYVFVDEIDKMKKIHSKIEVFEIINKDLIKAPKTTVVDLQEAKLIDSDNIIKIEYSRFGNGVFKDKNKITKIDAHNRYLKQEKINGIEYSTYTIAKEGKVIETVIYNSIYRIKDSSGVFFESVEHSPINDFIEDFISRNNYTGQIGFDIIERNNEIYLIDANPRATSGIHFLSGNLDLLNINKCSINKSKEYKGLLLAVLLLSEGRIYKKKKLLKRIFKYKEVVFRIKDPLPSLFQFLTLSELFYRKLKYKKNILAASTFDIEWDGKDFD